MPNREGVSRVLVCCSGEATGDTAAAFESSAIKNQLLERPLEDTKYVTHTLCGHCSVETT